MALIVVMSVFNGFEGVIISLLNSFNPDLSITIVDGKTFKTDVFPKDEIKKVPGLAYYTEIVEENALLKYQSKQYIATIKGVGSEFREMSRLDTMMVSGDFILSRGNNDFAIFGAGVAHHLGININDFIDPISMYVPKRNKTIGVNPIDAFETKSIFPSGVFVVQQEFDIKYVIVPLRFARELLDYQDEVTSIEIGIEPGSNVDDIKTRIQKIVGSDYVIKNRFEQQAFIYKIMKSEKWATFLILSFILLIAIFNVIGSLSMLILDKRKDISILSSLGANNQTIKRIFLLEGIMISVFGAITGLILGGLICWIQQTFGVIGIPSADSFAIDAYPVSLKLLDFVYVFLTVFVIGFLAAIFPVRQISKKHLGLERKI